VAVEPDIYPYDQGFRAMLKELDLISQEEDKKL
jgi:hypothetical protein